MKKSFFTLAISLIATTGFAQWNQNGDSSTSGNLNIGNYQKDNGELTIRSGNPQVSRSYLNFDFGKTKSGLRSAKLEDLSTTLAFFTSNSNGALQDQMYIKGNGNVGIGTVDPQYKLDVNGDIKTDKLILKNINPPGSPTLLSRIYYGGHDLIIGSHEGSWANNSLLLRPGGASQGLLSTTFIMENALNIGQYQRKVLLQSNGVSYINGGNVGIGTENPQYKLDVKGDIQGDNNLIIGSTAAQSVSKFIIKGSNQYLNSQRDISFEFAGAGRSVIRAYRGQSWDNYLQFLTTHTNPTPIVRMHIAGNGNIGIGTENPKNLLDVNGTIRTKEVKVELENWSDFVFDKDYKLPSLQEVEAHINEHKHLPDVPSEAQVKEEGINLAEMQAKLLQKIEELTLYVIEQEKRITQSEQQNKKQAELIQQLLNQK